MGESAYSLYNWPAASPKLALSAEPIIRHAAVRAASKWAGIDPFSHHCALALHQAPAVLKISPPQTKEKTSVHGFTVRLEHASGGTSRVSVLASKIVVLYCTVPAVLRRASRGERPGVIIVQAVVKAPTLHSTRSMFRCHATTLLPLQSISQM